MIDIENTGPYSGDKSQHGSWIVEAIWGHRIERQPYSALMLEFLGMAEGMYRKKCLLAPTSPSDNPSYAANRCVELRNILFNNPQMEEILRQSRGDNDAAWERWLEVMKETASVGETKSADFAYLRKNFDSFSELVHVVRLLRNIAIDQSSERAWTMQFIFPIGPAALYEALFEKDGQFESTRRVFTRTGELCYLMLTRASETLRGKIRLGLAPSLDPENARNKLLLRLLSTATPDTGKEKAGTYLPYKNHPAFDRLAEDLAAIFALGLPNQDSFQYIHLLLGLHIYMYGIETANHWAGSNEMPALVCEILAPRSDLVRKAAIESYLDNDSLGSRAVRKFIDKTAFSDSEVQSVLADVTLDDVTKRDFIAAHLKKTCGLKEKNDPSDETNPKAYIQQFYTFAEKYYRTNTADGLTGLATGCGLLSRRGTNRFRYAPTDDLLRAIVLANVRDPMEDSAFLRVLYDRYRIIIGPIEAKSVVRPTLFDETDFKKNRERLLQHLVGMGLARRMSDACTYVINPMDNSRG